MMGEQTDIPAWISSYDAAWTIAERYQVPWPWLRQFARDVGLETEIAVDDEQLTGERIPSWWELDDPKPTTRPVDLDIWGD
jgi:hypothetical protein